MGRAAMTFDESDVIPADRAFHKLVGKGKRLFRRGYGHEHRATVHRRKLSATGTVPPSVSAAKPKPRSPRPSLAGNSPGAAQPQDDGQAARPVRTASLHPRAAAAKQLRSRSRHPRADRPRRAPDAHAGRGVLSAPMPLNHPQLSELKAQGLVPMMRAHQGLRLAIYAVAAALVLLFVALLAYWWLLPAPAAADSPYATADAGAAQSTAARPVGAGRRALAVPK